MTLCKTCEHPQRREIERQAKAGVPASVLASWTRDQSGGYVSRLALGRHLREHVGLTSRPGRREVSADFAAAVVEGAHERLRLGELQPTLRDGLLGQQVLDRREQAQGDRDWMLRLSLILSGRLPAGVVYELDPASAAIEAEFRPLLESGN